MGFNALAYAQEFRELVREIAQHEINRLRPKSSLATVTSISPLTGKCMVQFPGEAQSVPIRMFTIQPAGVGCVVRVEGVPGLRYVSDVTSGGSVVMLVSPNGTRYRISVTDGGTMVASPANS